MSGGNGRGMTKPVRTTLHRYLEGSRLKLLFAVTQLFAFGHPINIWRLKESNLSDTVRRSMSAIVHLSQTWQIYKQPYPITIRHLDEVSWDMASIVWAIPHLRNTHPDSVACGLKRICEAANLHRIQASSSGGRQMECSMMLRWPLFGVINPGSICLSRRWKVFPFPWHRVFVDY